MKSSKTLISFALLILISAAWVSSYILMKKSLLHLNPYQLASARMFVACWCFLPIALFYVRKLDRKNIKYLLIVGFFGSGIPSFCFAIAQTNMNSSLTGTLSSLTPIFTLLLGMLFFKLQPSFIKIFGICIGLCGAAMIMLSKTDLHGIQNAWYGWFVVLATILYAWSTNTIGKYLKNVNSIEISAVAFSLMVIPASILFYTTGAFDLAVSPEVSISVFYPVITLAILGSVITSIAYFYLINISGSLFASTVSYLTPVVAILLGLYDGEKLFLIQYLGILVLLSGIVFTRFDIKKSVQRTTN